MSLNVNKKRRKPEEAFWDEYGHTNPTDEEMMEDDESKSSVSKTYI